MFSCLKSPKVGTQKAPKQPVPFCAPHDAKKTEAKYFPEGLNKQEQLELVHSLRTKKFAGNESELKRIAALAGTMHWHPEALENFCTLITLQNFGKNPEVLTILAESIGKIAWHHQNQLHLLAFSIGQGVFGNDQGVLKALEHSIRTLRYDRSQKRGLDFNELLEEISVSRAELRKASEAPRVIDLEGTSCPGETKETVPLKRDPFVFTYKKSHILAKTMEEDRYAMSVLTNPIHNENIFRVANQMADKIEANDFNYESFIRGCAQMADDHPVLKWKQFFHDKESFVSFLRNRESNVVHLISVLWYSPQFVKPVGDKTRAVFRLYTEKIKNQRDHIDDPSKIKLRNDSFGNSKTIQSDVFRSFFPYSHDVDYRVINKATKNEEVKKYLDNNIPYVSGTSGMANSASNIFHVLDIPIDSELGRSFVESASAFIVGSGMHSYTEVYTAFNLYREHISSS